MHIDTIPLLYSFFQMCRGGTTYRHAALVDGVPSIVAVVRRTGCLEIDTDDPDAAAAAALLPSTSLIESRQTTKVSEANQSIFNVIAFAVDDLRGLAKAEEVLATRNLGYAFHSLPQLLLEPRAFDPRLFSFSLRFVAYHWTTLSVELRIALARLMRVEPAALEKLVRRDGFAQSMFSTKRAQ